MTSYAKAALRAHRDATEPESDKLRRELQQFYTKHPTATYSAKHTVNGIRAEFEQVAQKLQEDFDKQYEETVAVFIKRELDYVKSQFPEKK